MEVVDEILHEIEAGLISQQRFLAALTQRQQDHAELASLLDPLVTRVDKTCVHLTEARDELRSIVVARRT